MAVIAKQRYKLDIAPSGGWVIVYASQHDNGAREIEFEITNQGNAYSIPASINISVQGIKSNKGYFSHSCSYSGNVVTMALADDMTDVIGKAICVLKFTNSSQQKLATAKFILNVDSDSSSEGIIIDTEAEEIFNQMLNEIRAQATSISADIAELQSMVGSPLVASTVSAMTDHNKIYVYTGSESGYTNGNWYYWNGSAWTSGGVYNAVAINIDSTPTQGSSNVVSSGGVYSAIEEKGGLSEGAKTALLACFQHVLWSSEDGSEFYEALEEALNSSKTLLSITATYISAGHTVYPYDTLNSLKEYITVTADYSDGTQDSVDIDECTLSGGLDSSTSTIIVTYQNKTAQVNVSVTIDADLAYYVTRGTELNGVDSGFSTGYIPSDTNKAVTIVCDFTDTSIADRARSMSVIYNSNSGSGYAALINSSASGSNFVKQYAINCHGAGSRKLENLTNASHRMRFAFTHAANSNFVYGNLYVDNTVVCENVEMSATYKTDSTPLYVGKRPSGGYLAKGIINLCNIYNRVLTQSEIKNLLGVN